MLEKLKAEVVSCAKNAEQLGLCRNKSGNFSCRDRDTGLILMTPTGADRSKLQADDIVVMNPNGEVVEALTGLKPTSEALMHIAAYEARPEVMAVVHTHSKYAVTFAAIGRKIPAIIIEAAHLNPQKGYIPLAPFARQGTKELGDSVKEPLKECDGILLANHGALTVADNLSAALTKAAYVEEIAEIYYHTLLLGAELQPLPPDDLVLRYPDLNKIK